MSNAGTERKPAEEWFWCPGCDIDFKDPHAQVRTSDTWDDQILGQCPECDATIENDVREPDFVEVDSR